MRIDVKFKRLRQISVDMYVPTRCVRVYVLYKPYTPQNSSFYYY